MARFIRDIATALALLTRLPVPGADFGRSAKAAWAWPLVGLLVGSAAMIAASSAMTLGLPATLVAGVALAVPIIMTGAMHEDGLADSADGLWGGWDRDKRLAIMRDSQIGTYGVLILIITVALRWLALVTLIIAEMFLPVIAAAILSRMAMAPLAFRLPHARDDGLSVVTGRPTVLATLGALVVGIALSLPLAGPLIVPALAATSALTLLIAMISKEKIGGQTGDILGATQQITEIGMLLTFVSFLN